MSIKTNNNKALSLSIVSLLACFVGQTIFANNANTNANKATIKVNNTKNSAITSQHSSALQPARHSSSSTMIVVKEQTNMQSKQLQARTVNQEFKLTPRLSLWGFTGDDTLAAGQFMLPIYGNQSQVFYGLAEGNYVDEEDSLQNWEE